MTSSTPIAASYIEEIEITESEAVGQNRPPIINIVSLASRKHRGTDKQALRAIGEHLTGQRDLVKPPITRNRRLERDSRNPLRPVALYNNPALVEKVPTLTTKLADLEKASLLTAHRAATPPTRPAASDHHQHVWRHPGTPGPM